MFDTKAYNDWANNHVLSSIYFDWYDRIGHGELTLNNKTYNEACRIARTFGWKDSCWYKPWTWCNSVVTVG